MVNRFEELKSVELGEKIGYKKGYEAARKQFERPHGEWVLDINGDIHCPNCGILHKVSNFCSYCGSDNRPKEGGEK